MELIYKTLFEIKLLNEYFLTREDGSTLLNESDPVKRQQLLEDAFEIDKETMNRDIDFSFPEKWAPVYESCGLKLLESYGGCRVVTRVTKKILPDRSVVFQPFFAFPPSLQIFISIVKKNNLPDIHTNCRVTRSLQSNYIFSNENIPDARVFPFLVNKASAYVAGSKYEQGEVVLDNANNPQEVYYDKTGNQLTSGITTAVKNYANENDRMLLPSRFNFLILNDTPVTQVTITLKDRLGNVVKNFSFNQQAPIHEVSLDFSEEVGKLQFSGNAATADAIFTLLASGNNGYSDAKKIIFDDTLYSDSNWGLIYIRPTVSNPAFNLFASDGFIIKRQSPLGVWTEAPVFEIPVKSRLSHFRYINNKGKKLDLLPALNNYLGQENEVLVSLVPIRLSHYYFLVPDNTHTTTKYLPNPVTYDLKKDDKQRLYFDVFVPESDLFPIIP